MFSDVWTYVTVDVATVVVVVLVATVVVTVVFGAVDVHVWRGTGYFDEQKVSAGAKPFRMEAALAGRPPLHNGVGQQGAVPCTKTAKLVNNTSTSEVDFVIVEAHSQEFESSVLGGIHLEQTRGRKPSHNKWWMRHSVQASSPAPAQQKLVW